MPSELFSDDLDRKLNEVFAGKVVRKDLLHRIGASYHKVSGFLLEGGPGEAAPVRAEVSAASA